MLGYGVHLALYASNPGTTDLQHHVAENAPEKVVKLKHYPPSKPRHTLSMSGEQAANITMEGYKDHFTKTLHRMEITATSDVVRSNQMGSVAKRLPDASSLQVLVANIRAERNDIMNIVFEGAVYEGRVTKTEGSKVEVFLPKPLSRQLPRGNITSRFYFGRYKIRLMHRALSLVSDPNHRCQDFLFPVKTQLRPDADLKDEDKGEDEDGGEDKGEPQTARLLQMEAVQNIADRSHGTVPYLIVGHPGTGKMVIMTEAIKLILQLRPAAHILMATQSATTADLLAGQLKGNVKRLLRLNAPCQALDSLPYTLRHVSNSKRGRYVYPTMEHLATYSVLVTTLQYTGYLVSVNYPTKLTHIFVHEEGATESESVLPLQLQMVQDGQFVIAGTEPPSRFRAPHSLLQRLRRREVYNQVDGQHDARYITVLPSLGRLQNLKHGRCLKCMKVGLKNKCRGCRSAVYCSDACHISDWKRHRKRCADRSSLIALRSEVD
jgi:hypothetical protein